MKNKMRIVLDTNILVVSIASKSKYHWILQRILNGDFELYISNDILMEYTEIISLKFNAQIADDIARMLLILPNVFPVSIFYNWNLVPADPDDNKFVDCAVTANAHYLITNDKHFSILSGIGFPKVNVLSITAFATLMNQ